MTGAPSSPAFSLTSTEGMRVDPGVAARCREGVGVVDEEGGRAGKPGSDGLLLRVDDRDPDLHGALPGGVEYFSEEFEASITSHPEKVIAAAQTTRSRWTCGRILQGGRVSFGTSLR